MDVSRFSNHSTDYKESTVCWISLFIFKIHNVASPYIDILAYRCPGNLASRPYFTYPANNIQLPIDVSNQSPRFYVKNVKSQSNVTSFWVSELHTSALQNITMTYSCCPFYSQFDKKWKSVYTITCSVCSEALSNFCIRQMHMKNKNFQVKKDMLLI